ncbi:MAG: cupin domain-containing protein [Desulfatiglandaceae bacterium]
MEVVNAKNVNKIKIDKFPYKGKPYDVKGITVQWLSKYGEDDMGTPEYGLRLFTAEPGGEIPIHNHFYHQSMYILTGSFECWWYDRETDLLKETFIANSGDCVYVPSMEAHGMKNLSDTQTATFLCCICNVYDDEAI